MMFCGVYAPASIDRGHIIFGPSVCPCVRLSVRSFVRESVCLSVKFFTLAIFFYWKDLGGFIFHKSIPCDKTFLFFPSSRSSVKVKVKYQSHSFRKNGRCGGISVSFSIFIGTGLFLNSMVYCIYDSFSYYLALRIIPIHL